MIRFIFPIVTIAAIMTMGACSGQDPVADEVNNGAAAPSEVEVLPPDEKFGDTRPTSSKTAATIRPLPAAAARSRPPCTGAGA